MPDPSPDPAPQLAAAIRALGAPAFPDRLTDWFQAALSPDNLLILAYRGADPPEVLHRWSPRGPVFRALDDYLAGAWRLDPYLALHEGSAAPGLYRLADLAPPGFRRSRYYLGYYRATTLIDEATFLARPGPGTTLMLCLGRDAASGRPFTAATLAEARRIASVAAALAERHWPAGHQPPSTPSPSPSPAVPLAAGLAHRLHGATGIALTPRQAEIALLVLRGHSSASVALHLGLSPQTVKVFRRQIHARCGVTSQAELFALLMPHLSAPQP
ncbi:helix-turn-helix transcriptional regulator [Neotabrizicola shimadae]|uniref:Helix-turn-helix transcriptional regulator n=1 Tax=Neotabrizicola shimadae TaxID=2807096 RepID=A0A8G0ZXY4_9RHOB|nr:helix-turn-helix transcriptional regulator [Neotabrizicola shimadae]QYZ70119.1 helix-turn-helix transcriptional regulator [Neotabrizicola shimadae]